MQRFPAQISSKRRCDIETGIRRVFCLLSNTQYKVDHSRCTKIFLSFLRGWGTEREAAGTQSPSKCVSGRNHALLRKSALLVWLMMLPSGRSVSPSSCSSSSFDVHPAIHTFFEGGTVYIMTALVCVVLEHLLPAL